MTATNQSPIYASAFRLAAAHYHGWASNYISFFHEEGIVPPSDIARINESMDADDSPFGPGIRPENSHRTGTGRTRWSADQDGVIIDIHRPASVVRAVGSLCVLQAVVTTNHKGEGIRLEMESSALAEDRHYISLFRCLWALDIAPNSNVFLDAVRHMENGGDKMYQKFDWWARHDENGPKGKFWAVCDPNRDAIDDLVAAGNAALDQGEEEPWIYCRNEINLTPEEIMEVLVARGGEWAMRQGNPDDTGDPIPMDFIREDSRGRLGLSIIYTGAPIAV